MIRLTTLQRCRGFLAVFGLLLALSTPLLASNWPHWRGPNFNGSTDESGLPATFSKTENVKWVADLPGPAAATPIIWNDHVFLNGVNQQEKTTLAMALDRKSGKVLWSKETGSGIDRDNRSNFASPSPVTDGKLVYFFYGNGELVAFDFAGTKIWSRNLEKDYGPFAFQWTFSSSPTVDQQQVIMQVLQRNKPVHGRGNPNGESYLLSLDPKTGKNIWKMARASEAREESLEAFSTPIPVLVNGYPQLLIAGGDCLSATHPKTGAELWRWGTWNPERITHWRLVPSPVAGQGMALVCGPKGSPIYAVKLDGAKGTLPDTGFAWKTEDRDLSSDVATPLFYNNKFFILNGDKNILAKVEPATGKVVWKGELGLRVKIESSPTGADGKLYFMNFKGEVVVADAGDAFKILHRAAMGDAGDDMLRSSIAVSQGNLFIRTGNKLYCIGG